MKYDEIAKFIAGLVPDRRRDGRSGTRPADAGQNGSGRDASRLEEYPVCQGAALGELPQVVQRRARDVVQGLAREKP